jgi:hypothetical protein
MKPGSTIFPLALTVFSALYAFVICGVFPSAAILPSLIAKDG